MRKWITGLVILLSLVGATVGCYSRALLQGEQFAYRDAAHFYYPLYERVQKEWQAGRWPLWEPEENAGMPLMGNPTAAVLYPGKFVFAVTPYPLGARLYVIGHTLLALATMAVLLRSWGLSATATTLGALAYGFGAPVLFQYCNIIYLVGAAWMPLGFHALDQWLRHGRRWAVLELAVVLAMETLGGDPEEAYLTGVVGGLYALALAWRQGRAGREEGTWRSRPMVWVGLLIGVVGMWVAGTLTMAAWASTLRARDFPTVALPWIPYVAPAVAGLWGLIGILVLRRWRRERRAGRSPRLIPMLAGLALAAVLGGSLSAAQLLPCLEFTGQSSRAAFEGPHDIYPFSLEPQRVVEFLWPNPFGTPFNGNRSWLPSIGLTSKGAKVWVPSLYLGGLVIVLALGAIRLRADRPERVLMSVVVIGSLLGSFGEYTGPIYWSRFLPAMTPIVGPHDKEQTVLRRDGHLRDGDGGVYWTLATLLPGFRQFRFPSKLLTMTTMGLAALAAMGWDALVAGDPRTRRRVAFWAIASLAFTAVALTVVTIKRDALIAWLLSEDRHSPFGPLDAPGAIREMQRGMVQALLALGVALFLNFAVRRRPVLAGLIALMALSTDLTVANARYVLTLPQPLMETRPTVLTAIEEAEKANPTPGPYRIHRMPIWNPYGWGLTESPDRVRDFVVWERDTIQPKYGVTYGVQYTQTIGVAELFDYDFFFGTFERTLTASNAGLLQMKPGESVVVLPRRSLDLWNSRYFVLPYIPKWDDQDRGYATLVDQSERIYPPPEAFKGPGGEEKERDWGVNHDFQVRRNLSYYPRAWVVHDARFLRPIHGLSRDERRRPMEEILFSNEVFWTDPTRRVYDPERVVWLEVEPGQEPIGSLSKTAPLDSERPRITRYESDRVEIEVHLDTPAILVLADAYYPGWTLTINDTPAPILRANRMMRGAVVPAGDSRLVFTYQPRSFRLGLAVSTAALASLLLLGGYVTWRPLSPR